MLGGGGGGSSKVHFNASSKHSDIGEYCLIGRAHHQSVVKQAWEQSLVAGNALRQIYVIHFHFHMI